MTPDARPSASLSGTINVFFLASALKFVRMYFGHRRGKGVPFSDETPRGDDLIFGRGPDYVSIIISKRRGKMVFWKFKAGLLRLGRTLRSLGSTLHDEKLRESPYR